MRASISHLHDGVGSQDFLLHVGLAGRAADCSKVSHGVFGWYCLSCSGLPTNNDRLVPLIPARLNRKQNNIRKWVNNMLYVVHVNACRQSRWWALCMQTGRSPCYPKNWDQIYTHCYSLLNWATDINQASVLQQLKCLPAVSYCIWHSQHRSTLLVYKQQTMDSNDSY